MTDTVLATADPGAALHARRSTLPGTTRAVGPATHLADERRRLAGLSWTHFQARQLGATIGAELSGIDLCSDLSDEQVAEIRQALWDYKVIFFRGQPLTAAQHVAFARRFGELEIHPFIPANAETPELVHFEKTAEVAGYENSWHHDVTWRATPSLGAVLHALRVPTVGGDTLFADMYAAYDGLADDVKARIDTLVAAHDFMRSFGSQVPPDQREAVRARYPVVEHPVVCTHAATGKRHLYVNHNFVSHLVGVDPDEGAELLAHLCAQADSPEYQCRFHWEDDSVAFWDNRAVQHYASSDYWPEIRIMERASIVGTRPTA